MANNLRGKGEFMSDIKLSSYLETHTQEEAARVMGVTQSAVSQMIAANRVVYLKARNGEISGYYEIKPGRKLNVGVA